MSFLTTLQQIREGALLQQLSDELQDVITSVVDHEKAGALQLTLKVKPNGDRAVIISSSVKATQAKASVGDAVFYADTGGTLHRSDPRQGDIEDEIARQRAKRDVQ
jgi:phosphoserine phosphatase